MTSPKCRLCFDTGVVHITQVDLENGPEFDEVTYETCECPAGRTVCFGCGTTNQTEAYTLGISTIFLCEECAAHEDYAGYEAK